MIQPRLKPRRLLGIIALGWLLAGAPLAHADEYWHADGRWLVLGGDIAETLAALDADINVVARDDTVLYPPEMAATVSRLSTSTLCGKRAFCSA